MAPATVQVVCMEPVVFLRGQSAVGEDARGRRRPINFDAPPSQLRGLLTLTLPRPSRIKDITITLQGKARTDWPEGIGPNRLDTVEESVIFKQKVTLYNARDTAPSRTRPRASSIGPGIDWPNDEFEWPGTPTTGEATTPNAGHGGGDLTTTPPLATTEARQSPKLTNKGKGRATTPAAAAAAAATSYFSISSSAAHTPPSLSRRSGIKGLFGSLRKEDGHPDTEHTKNARFTADASGSHRQASPSSGGSRSTAWMYEAEEEGHSDWREFPKGTHSYPFSIPLPSNLPPTLHADFGSNAYRLRAHVHRAGPLTSNLSAETEVTLVHAPDEDGQDEVETIVVERSWEDALRYMIVVMGKSFPVGGRIPVWTKFVPMEKVRIHRILASLEERTAYYAKGRRIARHEVPRRWTLLKVVPTQTASKSSSASQGILPILSSDPNAILDSPLAPLARAAAISYADVMTGGEEDAVHSALASLADPSGPWEFTMDLELPRSGSTRINISSNHLKSNIAVHHTVKLSIRVERLDAYGSVNVESIPDSQRKLYDILIEAPVAINHSHTANAWLTLPDYWSVPPAADETSTNDITSSSTTSQRWLRLTAAAAAAAAAQSLHGPATEHVAPQSRQATVTYSSSYLSGNGDPANEIDDAGLPTYAMIDGARGSVDPPPGQHARFKTTR